MMRECWIPGAAARSGSAGLHPVNPTMTAMPHVLIRAAHALPALALSWLRAPTTRRRHAAGAGHRGHRGTASGPVRACGHRDGRAAPDRGGAGRRWRAACAGSASGRVTRCKQGQVLFELDARPYPGRARPGACRPGARPGSGDQRRAGSGRYETLAEKQYVTAQQYEQVRTTRRGHQATLAGSQAAVDEARLNLQYATIRAPIAGRTGSLLVREGNLVRANTTQPLVTINQIRPILVRFAVPAANLPLIQEHLGKGVGGAGRAGGRGRNQRGHARASWTTRWTPPPAPSCSRARFPNDDGALWPGEFVNVRLQLYVDTDALSDPGRARWCRASRAASCS